MPHGSLGRSPTAITRSIRERVLTLPDETVVIPGHGPETSVVAERENNPFVGKSAR